MAASARLNLAEWIVVIATGLLIASLLAGCGHTPPRTNYVFDLEGQLMRCFTVPPLDSLTVQNEVAK
jgi:hypothetical protein